MCLSFSPLKNLMTSSISGPLCPLLTSQPGHESFVLVSALSLWEIVCTVCVYEWLCVFCHCRGVSGCAPCRTVFWGQVDTLLTDIGGDSSTVAYGNRLLTAKTWHQRKQVSQAWQSVLLRGLRDRLSAYSGIITPITRTIIPDKGEGSQTKYTSWCWLKRNRCQVSQKKVMDQR